MASTYSTDLRLELIGTGEQQGVWGQTTNKNLGTLIEAAIAGGISQDITGLTTYTLTVVDGLPDQARAAFLRFTGTLTGTCNIVAPSVSKSYIIRNDTTGGYPIQIKTATGAVIIVPAGESSIVECNGLDFYSALTCINDDARITGDLAVDGALSAGSLALASPLPVLSGGTGVTTSTGTTNVVLSNSPTLITPALGTPTALVGTNITGTAASFTAGTVTTNANLTGVITSSGNTTSIASQTGSGSKFVVDTNPVLVAPNLGTPTAGALTSCTSLPIDGGTTGTLPVGRGGTGTNISSLATGILTNTTGTGVLAVVAAPAGAVVGTTDTQTLTNKRVNPRVVTAGTTTGSITPTGDASDQYQMIGLTGSVTILGPSGTPVSGQKLTLRLKDNGTGRALTWTTTSGGYRIIGTTLPTTTVASKNIYVGCIYNSTDIFWDVVAVSSEA